MKMYEDEPVSFSPDFSSENIGAVRALAYFMFALFGVACAVGGYLLGAAQ